MLNNVSIFSFCFKFSLPSDICNCLPCPSHRYYRCPQQFFFFFAFFWPDFPHHCQNRLGSKNRTSLTTLQRTYIPIPEVAMLILLQQNGSFMTATFSILPDILEGLKVFPIWWLIQTQASVGR